MSVMLKIFIYNLLWLAKYQCKSVVKFNSSDLFLLGLVSEVIKTVELATYSLVIDNVYFVISS